MDEKSKFFKKYKFSRKRAWNVGVEREQFVVDPVTHLIVPDSHKYLTHPSLTAKSLGRLPVNFGYELSACQLESKIGPCELRDLVAILTKCEEHLRVADKALSLQRAHIELAPDSMPLTVYPDPTGRYAMITKSMPQNILSAACRVAGTHIHIGMPDIATAIDSFNRSLPYMDDLIEMGDSSKGERMRLYRTMAKDCIPKPFLSKDDLYQDSVAKGYSNDPRSCWTLIRISVHGTIEFRMFGATSSVKQIEKWASACFEICR